MEHHHTTHAADKYAALFNEYSLHLHDETVRESTEKLLTDRKKDYNTAEVRQFLLRVLDFTSLKVTDTEESILRTVEKINNLYDTYPQLPTPAALCVYPRFASIVNQSLELDGIEVACVAGGFPSSQTFPEVKTVEATLAIRDGATEIDYVFPVGDFLEMNYEQVSDEISEMKAVCNEAKLKVILETEVLQTAENIQKAALLASSSGADFIKTSTGKLSSGATPEAVYVLCQTLKEYYTRTGVRIGLKVAGGVQTPEQAIAYYTLVREILGDEWLTPALFRIGTSRLLGQLASELLGKKINI